MLIDSIEYVTKEKLQKAHPRVELVVEPGSAHEDFIFDRMLGYKGGVGEGSQIVESWMAQRMR